MLYKEYSQMAGKQGMLAELNQALVEQLKKS
jgi:flagellar protein FlgJ